MDLSGQQVQDARREEGTAGEPCLDEGGTAMLRLWLLDLVHVGERVEPEDVRACCHAAYLELGTHGAGCRRLAA